MIKLIFKEVAIMKKIYLAPALALAVLSPFAINEYINSLCPELPKEVILPSSANALPSFAHHSSETQ